MQKERIESAVEVIDFAINNNVSVKQASVKCGFADTYIKNIKGAILALYDNNQIDDELFSMFFDKYNQYLAKGNGFINNDAFTTQAHEMKKDFQKLKDNISTNSKISQAGNKAEFEWKGGSNYPVDHIKTVEELLIAAKVDTTVWKVKDFVVNKWDVTSTRNGEAKTYQNFQVKARLERIEELFRLQQAVEVFKELVVTYIPPVLKTTSEFSPKEENVNIMRENNLLEISIFDLHMGKLAWAGETGENYDTKIARERFLDTIQTLIQRANVFNYERVLFPVGNDFFNSDTIYNTTTQGTPQDEDLRWQKTYKVGTRLLVDAINMLKQTGVPVDVIVIPGNHDFERTYYMGEFLDAWFHADTQVTINNSASPRKYYKFGEVLLGFTHGNEEKESSLPLIMANDIDSKPLWSTTKYHEFHLGHIHRKRNIKYAIVDKQTLVDEDLGVTIRYLSSLTGTEEWHHKKGFIGSVKAGDAFIWNDKLGLIAHINSNLKY